MHRLLAVMILIAVFAAGVATRTQFVEAQTHGRFADQLNQMRGMQDEFTIVFRLPVPPLGASVEVEGRSGLTLGSVGDDFACIERQTRANVQVQCVPYDNIAAIIFAR